MPRRHEGRLKPTSTSVPAAPWGTDVEVQVKARIMATVAAYAYEIEGDPIMSDAAFDDLLQKIDPWMTTGSTWDEWFREHFTHDTGMWVWQHPNKPRLADLTALHRQSKPRRRGVARITPSSSLLA